MKQNPQLQLSAKPKHAGLTLIELTVVVAVIAALLLIAAPSFKDMILMQRLRGINAQLVTDLQFARSEAIARNRVVRIQFSFAADSTQACYVIYASNSNAWRCNCLNTPVCPPDNINRKMQELRTVSISSTTGVTLHWTPNPSLDPAIGYDPATGGLLTIPSDQASRPLAWAQVETRVDDNRRFRNRIVQTGRVSVCAPNAAVMGGMQCT